MFILMRINCKSQNTQMLKNQVYVYAQIWKKTHINSPNLFWSIRETLHKSMKAEVWGSEGHQHDFIYREVPVYVGGLNLKFYQKISH